MTWNPTPLDVVPLHGWDLGPGGWWACDQPERPDDPWAAYDGRCRRCALALEAALAIDGDKPGRVTDANGEGRATRAEMVAEFKRYHEAEQ